MTHSPHTPGLRVHATFFPGELLRLRSSDPWKEPPQFADSFESLCPPRGNKPGPEVCKLGKWYAE